MSQESSTMPAEGVGGDGEKPKPSMRRVAFASFIGTLIEFYDFQIYGFAASIVFSTVFFPALGGAAGVVASFATLGVALVARPFGSVLFGHFGDRHGRKKTLITALFMMGGATVLVGVLPTTAQIGVWAPILLFVLRIFQGLAAGGEWAGAVLFASENAPQGRRGFWSMLPALGGCTAFVLAPASFALVSAFTDDAQFLSWGWRIPFLASIVLVAVGLWVRLQMDETPVFRAEASERGTSRIPLAEAFRRQPREMLLGTGIVVAVPTLIYLGATYLPNYATTVLGLSRTTVLVAASFAGLATMLGVLVGGSVSDRWGRRRTMIVTHTAAVVWGLAVFPVLNVGNTAMYVIGLCVTLLIGGLALGPVGAFHSELFATRYRYSASGLSYNFAQIIGGAIPPLVAAPIIASAGAIVYGGFLSALCLLSLLSVVLLRETSGHDLATVGHDSTSTK